MDEIIFVTHNKGKALSASKYFKNLKVSTYNYELNEPRSDDIKLIATAKVMEAYNIVKKPCMALDAGFFINSLNGFPRAFTNFAIETIGINGILKLMEDKLDRTCSLRECLAYYDGCEIKYFFGELNGTLSNHIHEDNNNCKWSSVWNIFIPDGFNKTLSEMSPLELNNHKYIDKSTNAMENFAIWFTEKENENVKKLNLFK